MAGHSPGPWRARAVRGDIYYDQVVDAEGEVISHGADYGPRAEADARLMAEAPTMLDLLRGLAEVHARWEADADRSAGDLLEIARAAAVEAREIVRRVDGGARQMGDRRDV
jgi:hypothetical protein